MGALYDPERHEPLSGTPWSADRAREAIAAACRDAEEAFDPVRLWPVHPQDAEPDTPDVARGLYFGAAGMLHALDRLRRAGLWEPSLDLAAIAAGLGPAVDEDGAGASLSVGAAGSLLIAHRVAPSAAMADALAAAIAENVGHPSNELLLGAPGTMLAARAMHGRTGEARFADLWRASARTLLERQEPDGLWTQELYGKRYRLTGAGHGFAGNVLALTGAPEWLDDPDGVTARAVATVRATAIVDGDVATWLTGPGAVDTPRVQWCHGAPGVITSLARIAPADADHTALLEQGGEFVWRAGPCSRSAGLCHGTAGNGFAFLALHARTGDGRWFDRACAFAAHALEQVGRLRATSGCSRHSLFSGDIGAALLAAACLTADAAFPGLDDL